MSTTVLDLVLDSIIKYLAQEIIKAIGVAGDIEEIGRRLEGFKSFLVDADNDLHTQSDSIKKWVKEMQDAAYEAEDILDLYYFDAIRHGMRGQAKRALFITNISISKKIGSLNKKLNGIQKDKEFFKNLPNSGLRGGGVANSAASSSSSSTDQSRHHVLEDEVVGFNDVTGMIMEQLLDHQSSTSQLPVVSIVGMGGLGKSTLAWKIYNSNRIRVHFQVRIWVYVSQNCRFSDVLKKIMDAILSNVQPDQSKCPTVRYLVVLDDVWEAGLWEMLRGDLPNLGIGSRVLMTTRSLVVAKKIQSPFLPHQLRLMDDHESAQLLRMRAFRADETSCPSRELEDLIPRLARKCSGLPLALFEVGTLLVSKEKSYKMWKRTLDSFNWQVEGLPCMRVLAKSYRKLPRKIKPCFLYLATFPLDYEISASILFKLWIAEGFISSEGSETYEDAAEKYLEHLVEMSLVHVVKKKNHNGSVKTCRVHRLLHELARSEAANGRIVHVECKKNKMKSTTTQNEARRLAVHDEIMIDRTTALPNLRTFAAFSERLWPEFQHTQFRLLKVLELSDVHHLQSLPPVVTDLVLLRYLGLRHTKSLRDLPRSMNELENLETLDMKGSAANAPTKIWEIKSLRHVLFSINVTTHRTAPPGSATIKDLRTLVGISSTSAGMTSMIKFTHLRKLKVFLIDDANAHLFRVLLENLKELVSLKIQASKIRFGPNCTFAHESLRSLYLQGQWMPLSEEASYVQLAPEKLKFPKHLSKLTLSESQLNEDPMPWLGELRSLKVLTLLDGAYTGEYMECSTAGRCFPELKELKVSNLDRLKRWQIPDRSMPKLRSLCIDSCTELGMLPDLHHAPTLEELKLVSMPEEFAGRIMLREQDGYKVLRIPSVVFKRNAFSMEVPLSRS